MTFDWTPYMGDRATFEKVGDKVEGKIIEIHTEEGRKGLYPVVTLQVDAVGNRREVHPPTDLQRKLAAANVQVDDWLRAELVELKHTGQPSPMKVFRIALKYAEAREEAADPDPEPVRDVPDEFSDEPFK